METKWQIIKEEDGTYTLLMEAGTLQKPEWKSMGGPHPTFQSMLGHLGEPKLGEVYKIEFLNLCNQ